MYRGIRRVAIFLQRWPTYRRLPSQTDLGEDFIKKGTPFFGPWEPASRNNSRALNVQDIDDCLMGEIFKKILQEKGYTPFLEEIMPLPTRRLPVEEIMARGQALNRQVDAFLFCFYAPMVFLSHSRDATGIGQKRSYALQEIIQALSPGGSSVIWAGPRAAQAPKGSISHAFIYISMTMFKAYDWQPLWEVADSQTGGKLRVNLVQCPPGPTDKNYGADAAIIQRLMIDNLTCRLHHLIPDAF
ncbi:MAG: hypothetical protein HY743_03860 [Deltaproteobacteria bacterium]|nr:hypothetical protein [Deltaproteobacteria bacterium]